MEPSFRLYQLDLIQIVITIFSVSVYVYQTNIGAYGLFYLTKMHMPA